MFLKIQITQIQSDQLDLSLDETDLVVCIFSRYPSASYHVRSLGDTGQSCTVTRTLGGAMMRWKMRGVLGKKRIFERAGRGDGNHLILDSLCQF
jgi:hypothetical protein